MEEEEEETNPALFVFNELKAHSFPAHLCFRDLLAIKQKTKRDAVRKGPSTRVRMIPDKEEDDDGEERGSSSGIKRYAAIGGKRKQDTKEHELCDHHRRSQSCQNTATSI